MEGVQSVDSAGAQDSAPSAAAPRSSDYRGKTRELRLGRGWPLGRPALAAPVLARRYRRRLELEGASSLGGTVRACCPARRRLPVLPDWDCARYDSAGESYRRPCPRPPWHCIGQPPALPPAAPRTVFRGAEHRDPLACEADMARLIGAGRTSVDLRAGRHLVDRRALRPRPEGTSLRVSPRGVLRANPDAVFARGPARGRRQLPGMGCRGLLGVQG